MTPTIAGSPSAMLQVRTKPMNHTDLTGRRADAASGARVINRLGHR